MFPTQIFSTIGIAATGILAFRFLRFLYLYLRPSTLKRYLHGGDAWALVTGASDGIGRGFARELAHNGFNVALHGRNPHKLEIVKSQLQKEFPDVEFRTVVAEASWFTYEQIDELVAGLEDINLTVLVNNIGGADRIAPLEHTKPHAVDTIMNINARFPTQLTKALLPKLTQTSSPSLILNIGSMGDFSVPYATIYGGSKGFNMAWSSSLAVEMKSEGKAVEVLGIYVGKVTDVTHCKEDASFFTPNARTMAKASLQRVGCRRTVVVGHVGHAMQRFLVGVLPSSVFTSLITSLMKRKWEEEQKMH